MGNIIIGSLDDLFGFMALTLTGEATWNEVDLHQLHVTIPIRVYGPNRDGRIDPPGARLIQDLQRHAVRAFRQFGDTTTGGRSSELRVAVQDNCDFWDIDVTNLIKEAINRMSGNQTTATLCLFLLLGTGYFAFSKHQDTQLEIIKVQSASATQQASLEHEEKIVAAIEKIEERTSKTTEQLVEKIVISQESILAAHNYALALLEESKNDGIDAQQPIRRFTKTLKRGEEISINGDFKLTKRKAIEKIGKKRKDDTMYHAHADGEYEIEGIDLRGRSQGLRVKRDGVETFVILERLDAGIKESIINAVDESFEKKSGQKMGLQVDIYFKNSGIQYGVVIGVGPQRTGLKNYPLSDIPHSIPASGWLLAGTKE